VRTTRRPGFFVAGRVNRTERGNEMAHETGSYRRPYGRGDYHLVDTTRTGTYWRSREGIVVQLASTENGRATQHRAAPGWRFAFAMLAARVAGQ
jgi:hypothetical protein